MAVSKIFVVVAACLVLGQAQPVQQQLPVLKEQPSEVLFRVTPKSQPFVLECVTEGSNGKPIQYSWQKNGQPFDFKSDAQIVQRKDEGSLVFLKPTKEVEGRYQCFAQSDLGTASSRVINVKRTYLSVPNVTPKKHKPEEGKPYQLDCSVPDAYPKPSIVWHLQQESKPSVSHTILDRRITYSPEGTLYFTNITQEEDVVKGFKYVCLAKSPAVDDYVSVAEHIIEGVEPAKGPNSELTPLYVSKDMTAKVGDVTMLYCIYGGTPLAYPDWFKDGKNVNGNPGDRVTRHNRSSGKRLLIRETLLEDEGEYTCDVNNGVGKPQKHVMRLTVQSVPTFSKKPEQQAVVKEGQDVTVPCAVKGVPAPKVTWTYNAKPLAANNKLVLNAEGLVIKGIQKSDKGYYGCRAENSNGDIYAESLVQVL